MLKCIDPKKSDACKEIDTFMHIPLTNSVYGSLLVINIINIIFLYSEALEKIICPHSTSRSQTLR